MSYWVEVRSGVRRSSKPRLVPLEDAGKYTGFRSVFAYPDDVADLIIEQGVTSGLSDQPVYADTVFVDFDGRDSGEFRAWLRREGHAFEWWDSGNRSDHLHIPMEPLTGAWVPAAVKAWVRVHAPTADLSFYHQSGQYRLPHTFHAKQPGNWKHLVEKHEGRPVSIKAVTTGNVINMPRRSRDDAEARDRFFTLITKAAREGEGGGRTPHIWKLAVLGAESGFVYEETINHLLWWNDHYCLPPHSAARVRQQVDGAYKYMLRRLSSGGQE